MQFLTAPLDEQFTQSSDLRNLLDMYHEVLLYFDDKQEGASIATSITVTDDEDFSVLLSFVYPVVTTVKNVRLLF